VLKFYNFLSKKIEDFKPSREMVTLYTCGPTVYDFVHIGNWRTFVFEDILKRTLLFNGYKVKHVMNITDIDDKIIKASRDQRLAFREIADKYEKAFFEDLEKLNIFEADVYPRATENIDSMIQIIKKLIDKGFAYRSDDGVYFDISEFKDYGKLSNLSKREIKVGARIAADLYEKDNPADFALWKFPQPCSSPGLEPSWNAPFGRGRPGWHIECSAMSMKYLGDPSLRSGRNFEKFQTIDIHTGGVDLLFPHHENEIAQSETATDKKFVRFWLEGEHLLVEGEKMAKSLGNIFTSADIKERGFDPLALRYLFLTAHYRSKLNFTWKGLEAAQNALNNLREEVSTWDDSKIGRSDSESLQTRTSCSEFESNFVKAINNDLDIPKALSVMWEMVKSDLPSSAKHQSILMMDKVLGLDLEKLEKLELPKGVQELIDRREKLRQEGEFKKSDKLRKELQSMGVYVEDTSSGPKWKVKK